MLTVKSKKWQIVRPICIIMACNHMVTILCLSYGDHPLPVIWWLSCPRFNIIQVTMCYYCKGSTIFSAELFIKFLSPSVILRYNKQHQGWIIKRDKTQEICFILSTHLQAKTQWAQAFILLSREGVISVKIRFVMLSPSQSVDWPVQSSAWFILRGVNNLQTWKFPTGRPA